VTHSPHFVAIPEFHEVVLVTKDKDGTRVKTSSLTPELRRIEKFRKELDPERNELFFAKRVLLVEGDTEKLALPEYAKRLGLDIDNCGSTIVETGGKRNLPDFVDLTLSFDIPVALCYDIDSSDFQDKGEEQTYNATLELYAKKGVSIWRHTNKYEDELRKFLGEKEFQGFCQKYERTTKPIRARLIASDTSAAVPEFVKPIVAWLRS
jgi:predicted ATP-dependent endonuclease of OLD family